MYFQQFFNMVRNPIWDYELVGVNGEHDYFLGSELSFGELALSSKDSCLVKQVFWLRFGRHSNRQVFLSYRHRTVSFIISGGLDWGLGDGMFLE